jgi:cytosine/adenosine deaminase-related metal-dependent hydrolase
MPAGKALKMITIDAARVLGLDSQIGSLEKGKKADIILIDTFKAHLTPSLMMPQLLVYYGSGYDVKTVMVDGRILMEDRVVKTVDERKVILEAREEIEKAFHRFKKLGYPMERYTDTGEEFWKGPKQHNDP